MQFKLVQRRPMVEVENYTISENYTICVAMKKKILAHEFLCEIIKWK